MISGREDSISRILPRLNANSELGKSNSPTAYFCEHEYKECLQELIETNFLVPRLLARQEYVAAISGPAINPYMESLAEAIDQFQAECSLLLCGFNDDKEAYILQLAEPGIVTDLTRTGFGAVGSG